MIRRFILLGVLALWAYPSQATVAVVHGASGTSSTLTVTSTTIGNSLLVLVSSATAGTVKLGTQTATQNGQCTPAVSALVACAYFITSISVNSTSVTCTSCGSFNAIVAVEYSGANGVEPIVGCFSGQASNVCQQNNTPSSLGLQYQPGYSSEGVIFLETCSGSSGTPTLSGLSSTGTGTPNSNPVAWGISSGTTLTSMNPNTGSTCGQSNGIVEAVIGTGATQQPIANPNQPQDSNEVTSGSATISATVFNVGDLVVILPWCISTCGVTTLTLGAQNATCPASTLGVSNASAGQPQICYVIANSAGSKTITFTPSGSPSNFQVSAIDYTVSSNTTVSFDTGATANCGSGCSEGTTVTTPSITPAQTGSLLISFVSTHNHTSAPAGSWACYAYIGTTTGESLTCASAGTINMAPWILSSASGSTSADVSIITNNDPFQSILASFKLAAATSSINPVNKRSKLERLESWQ